MIFSKLVGRMRNKINVIVVMGVSGCGKTTVGELLAHRLGWVYVESDHYHSAQDIQKMSSGIPLNDEDRWPWLQHLNQMLQGRVEAGERVVLACSALKASYREVLARGLDGLVYVHLKGSYALIHARMQQRRHFMAPHMLQSQFDILEETPDLLSVDIQPAPAAIVEQILGKLSIGQPPND